MTPWHLTLCPFLNLKLYLDPHLNIIMKAYKSVMQQSWVLETIATNTIYAYLHVADQQVHSQLNSQTAHFTLSFLSQIVLCWWTFSGAGPTEPHWCCWDQAGDSIIWPGLPCTCCSPRTSSSLTNALTTCQNSHRKVWISRLCSASAPSWLSLLITLWRAETPAYTFKPPA